MKICPVCKAGAFDDAEVCYGCLHRFSQDDAQIHAAFSPSPGLNPPDSDAAQGAAAASEGRDAAKCPEPTSTRAEAASSSRDAEGACVSSACDVAGQNASKTVDVPVRGADIVVRIELVEVGSGAAGDAEEKRSAVSPSAPECVVLRRGRRAPVTDIARPAEAMRGAAAGQKGECVQELRARHAAVVRPQRQAEIA